MNVVSGMFSEIYWWRYVAVAEQTNIYANQFLAANPNLKPWSRARSWTGVNPTEMKTLTGLLRDIKEEAYQEMCSLLDQWKEEIVIILLSWLWESPLCSTVFSTPQHRQKFKKKNKK